jgi:membrane protease YdiL (CAAX protease family)
MTARLRTRTACVVTVAVLVAYHEARRLAIPHHLHFVTNTAMIGVMAAIAVAASLSRAEIGVGSGSWRKGLAYGAVVVAVIGVVVSAVALLGFDPTSDMADRAAVSGREMLFQVFVQIPIATVLFEELAFRGVLAPLLERLTSPGRALAMASVLFGLWHVQPDQFDSWGGVGSVLGTVAATTVAGAGFLVLKRRSGSLLAPALAHWGTNGVAFMAAWLAVRATH